MALAVQKPEPKPAMGVLCTDSINEGVCLVFKSREENQTFATDEGGKVDIFPVLLQRKKNSRPMYNRPQPRDVRQRTYVLAPVIFSPFFIAKSNTQHVAPEFDHMTGLAHRSSPTPPS